jgi:hypothetical protein
VKYMEKKCPNDLWKEFWNTKGKYTLPLSVIFSMRDSKCTHFESYATLYLILKENLGLDWEFSRKGDPEGNISTSEWNKKMGELYETRGFIICNLCQIWREKQIVSVEDD